MYYKLVKKKEEKVLTKEIFEDFCRLAKIKAGICEDSHVMTETWDMTDREFLKFREENKEAIKNDGWGSVLK